MKLHTAFLGANLAFNTRTPNQHTAHAFAPAPPSSFTRLSPLTASQHSSRGHSLSSTTMRMHHLGNSIRMSALKSTPSDMEAPLEPEEEGSESPFDVEATTDTDTTVDTDDIFVSDIFQNAIEQRNIDSDKTSTKKTPATASADSDNNTIPEDSPVLARDPASDKLAKRLFVMINTIKRATPSSVFDNLIDGLKKNINDSCREGSYVSEFLCGILDVINGSEPNEVKEEALYFLLRAMAILENTANTDTPNSESSISLTQIIALSGLDTLLSTPETFDKFGLYSAWKTSFEFFAGSRKDRAWGIIGNIKNELLNLLGKQENDSLATKVWLTLYLVFRIDTGEDVETTEFIETFQQLGVIISKVAQTVGGQANNPMFRDGGTIEAVIEACKFLQQYNPPMTEAEARNQMATYYEKQFGPDWEQKMFKSIDFASPIRTGTIAGVYKAILANDQEVIVKIRKPIDEKLAAEKSQVALLLRAVYDIVQEAVSCYERLDRPTPEILTKANLFQRSEESTKAFLERFESELKLENEAKAMLKTSCLTPKIISYTPNAIIMEYIGNGLSPFEYIEVNERTTPSNYAKADSAVNAIKGWLQTHYPYAVESLKITKSYSANHAKIQVHFAEGLQKEMNFNVEKKRSGWQVKPNESYVDFSNAARKELAAQKIADLVKQLKDGLLNCDAHAGNFIIAPAETDGKNSLYHIDFGLVETIDNQEKALAWNFIKGFLLNDEQAISKSYIDMTDKGRTSANTQYSEDIKRFGELLKESEYTKMLVENPDQAMGPVMEWLADENFNIDPKYYAIIRSFAGFASNAVTMQGGQDFSINQLLLLLREILLTRSL